ncbi:hypothetical protein [Streptomyces kebangsaanensis]|uniref:hypothetical protein n=1 Tax=Streptomyces kebangsaanensis TaxID=864058 RepID=UPI000AE5F408|nr:hypothetical protein [Streptomyces kebangsaanensis]
MSSSVIIDWEQLAAEERARCLRLQQEFIDTRAYARRLARRCAATQAVTGVRIGVPLVTTPGIEEGSAALAEQLSSLRKRLTSVEEQLDSAARGFAHERAAARPVRQAPAPAARPSTTAADELAAWRERESTRQRAETEAAAERVRAEAAEREAATRLARAADLAEALPDRAEEVHDAARAVLAGAPGAEAAFARLAAAGREAEHAARAREEVAVLRERIALVAEQVTAARDPKAPAYADMLRAQEAKCGDDLARLGDVLRVAQEVLGRLTAAESRAELIVAVHAAMSEVWSLTAAPGAVTAEPAESATGHRVSTGVAGAAGHLVNTVLVPLPDAFPHHAIRFDMNDADSLTAEIVRIPGGDPAADRAAQEHMCADMDELTARLAARGFASTWREQAPAGALPVETAARVERDQEAAERAETAAAAISRARAAARQTATQRTDPARGDT